MTESRDDLCRMSATQIREAVGARDISPVEVVDAVLERIALVNPGINAFCTLTADGAREQARQAEAAVTGGRELGPLHGVPVSIKDLVFTKGVRTTGGSLIFADFVPDQDAICVERLKAAGAIVLGKTNTPEFGYVAVTDNRIFGPTRNPWDLERTSGGSSGGAASAVAAGLGPLAIGSDGGGSIRIPGSFCGVFGLKPSYGRAPGCPGFPHLWEGLSVTGPITRTVADAALMMEVIAGRDDRDYFSLPDEGLSYVPLLEQGIEGLRVAWSPDLGYAAVDPEVLRVTEAAVRAFADLGCHLEEAAPRAGDPQETFSTVVGASLATFPGDRIQGWEDRVDRGLVRFMERSRDILATDYLKARLANIDYRDRVQEFFNRYDLLLTPAVAVPPFQVGGYGPREIGGSRVGPLGWMPFTFPFNITGQPAASVPCGFTSDGLPIGLQIVGGRFDDGLVLRAAAAFERARPWYDHSLTLG